MVALSEQLQPNKVLSCTVLGEWLAIFRGEDGQPVALRDRFIYHYQYFLTPLVQLLKFPR
ncbi:Rieske 2Fe-2S domain-containing protein [Nostoc sp. UIC 10607]|uniref:Rieske 2Fe-2S domain-containing protein n=1 Tax=Nostoc sp. UIC 10607 TaxID=3045935 RepID=UPI0039A182CB